VIEALGPLLEGRKEHDWLFTNRAGGPIFYRATRVRLVDALRAAGLPKGALHMLRRTAATLSLQQGTSVRDVQNLLGHASPLMTLTRYATVDVASQTAGSERVAGAILEAETGHFPATRVLMPTGRGEWW
jgi:integrase